MLLWLLSEKKKKGCYKTVRIRRQDCRVGDAWSHSRLKGQRDVDSPVEENETFSPKYCLFNWKMIEIKVLICYIYVPFWKMFY